MLGSNIYQDENVLQLHASKISTAPSLRRRALGDITNNGAKLQAPAGKDASGAGSGKIGLKKATGSTLEITKPTGHKLSQAVASSVAAANTATTPALSRLYCDDDYTELEFCYGRDLFGSEGRPYDAGLKIDSMRKAHANANAIYTSAVLDALGPNVTEQLEYDLEYIGVPTAPIQQSTKSTTVSSVNPTLVAKPSVTTTTTTTKIVRTQSTTAGASGSSTSIKPMGILKPLTIRSNAAIVNRSQSTQSTQPTISTLPQVPVTHNSTLDLQLDLDDLALDGLDL